MNINRL